MYVIISLCYNYKFFSNAHIYLIFGSQAGPRRPLGGFSAAPRRPLGGPGPWGLDNCLENMETDIINKTIYINPNQPQIMPRYS